MRRIHESSALHRDDDEPLVPSEGGTRGQAFRSVDSTALSRWLVPEWLCRRAVAVDVSTPRTEYRTGATIPFTVTMENAMPFPVAITTRSRVLWQWTVDGLPAASRVDPDHADESGVFAFARGERKQFRKRWDGRFQVAEREWADAGPGAYAIGARINAGGQDEGLGDETTVRIVA